MRHPSNRHKPSRLKNDVSLYHVGTVALFLSNSNRILFLRCLIKCWKYNIIILVILYLCTWLLFNEWCLYLNLLT